MSEAPEKRPPRGWVTRICWFLAGSFLLLTGIRVLGLEAGVFPVVQLMAYTPYLLALCLVAVLAVGLLRRWPPAGLLLVAAIVLAVLVLPRGFGGTEEVDGGTPVRVLTANLAKGKANPDALLELAGSKDADIVFLQEASSWKVRQLNRAGFARAYPRQVLDVTDDDGGQAIFSRWPLHPLPSLAVGRQPRATVDVPGAGRIEVVSVHPTAPIKPGTTRGWDRDYASMPAASSGRSPLVLAGDFNATLDHENLRDLIATGYRDAGDVTGNGFTPTWPAHPGLSPSGISLPVTIDHVLAEEGIAFSDYGVEKITGSDHRAVFAELLLPPATGEA